jgi:D-psicose/D-tagatose/L-ribulose 3-epimerase
MHLSMHNWMRVEPLERTCERLAQCGYESIEIMGEPEAYADRAAVRATLAKHGIRCWGSVTLMLEDRDLLHPDDTKRAASIQYVMDCIDLVADLGGEEITIVPGLVGKTKPTAAAEQEWDWAVAGLREIYEHAGPKHVRLALEPLNRFETYFINSGAQAVALAEAVGEDCGVCLDCFHMNIEEADVLAAIRSTGNRLADFHVADSNRMAPGMGHLDWPLIVEQVRSVGYDGALTSEFVPSIDRTPINPYPDALETEDVEISAGLAQFIEDHGSDVVSDSFYTWLVQATADTLLPLVR